MAALLQLTEEDMKDILGNQQNGEEIAGNISTSTAELIQNRLDMQTYIYMSNFAKAMKYGGKVWLSMAKDLYVEEERKMSTVGYQGEVGTVELMKPTTNEEGEIKFENDLSEAKFDVVVDVGPSSSTKRASVVRSLVNMMPMIQDPEMQMVLSLAAINNMEGEGLDDFRAYSRKRLLQIGAVEPTEKEAQEMAAAAANAQPTPQDQYLIALAENERAKAVGEQADILLTQAKTDETNAKAAELANKIGRDNLLAWLEAVEKLQPRVTPPEVTGSDLEQ